MEEGYNFPSPLLSVWVEKGLESSFECGKVAILITNDIERKSMRNCFILLMEHKDQTTLKNITYLKLKIVS